MICQPSTVEQLSKFVSAVSAGRKTRIKLITI